MNQELIYGASRAFRQLIERVDAYARSPWPVLILGETGVGKELIARRLHQLSGRPRSRYLPLNCSAVPTGLFESELFGYERGAFSGAVVAHAGLLRQAREGSLFLDEIGELDFALQAKLLRFLDSGEVRSVGSTRVESVDVRVIAATNVNLFAAANHGTFRADLLERLSVLTLHIPPLRERLEDIGPIATHLLRELGLQMSMPCVSLLQSYEWPGNVRQLRNVLVRAATRAAGKITQMDLEILLQEERAQKTPSPQIGTNAGGKDLLQGSLAEIEKQIIVAKLLQCQGNRKRTAKELGIAKSTLHEKLRRWRIEESNDNEVHSAGLGQKPGKGFDPFGSLGL